MSNKKIITLILTGILAVSTLGGCAKKEAKKEAIAQQVGVQATKEEVKKADVKTEDGKQVSEKVQEKAVQVDKNTELLEPLIDDFIKTMYNYTPSTLKATVDKLNAKAFDKRGFKMSNTTKYLELNKENTDVLKNYKTNEITYDIPITDKTTNIKYDNCVVVYITINYVENGKDRVDNLDLIFTWDANGKTWKQLNIISHKE